MSKRKVVKAKRTNRRRGTIGCAVIIIILGLAAIGSGGKKPSGGSSSASTERPVETSTTAAIAVQPTTDSTLSTSVLPLQSGATAAVQPSATITDTPTSTLTSIPATAMPTSAPAEIWYTQNTANLRSCSKTNCQLIIQIPASTPLQVIGFEQGELYKGSDIWRIVIYNGQRAYIHSSLIAINPPAPTSAPIVVQPVQPPPVSQVQQPPSSVFICPRTCSTAVALGMEEHEIAQKCPNLDKNSNGVACYGS